MGREMEEVHFYTMRFAEDQVTHADSEDDT